MFCMRSFFGFIEFIAFWLLSNVLTLAEVVVTAPGSAKVLTTEIALNGGTVSV